MSDLTEFARGRSCLLRLPGVCNRDPATSVLAHVRRAGSGGMGVKPPDIVATIACSSCHDVLDGRAPLPLWLESEMDGLTFDAVVRFLCLLAEEGLV